MMSTSTWAVGSGPWAVRPEVVDCRLPTADRRLFTGSRISPPGWLNILPERVRVPTRRRGKHRRACRAPPHLPVLRSDEPEVLREGSRPRSLGFPEAPPEGAEAVRAGRHPADEGQLPP